jgi:hypothetical protein
MFGAKSLIYDWLDSISWVKSHLLYQELWQAPCTNFPLLHLKHSSAIYDEHISSTAKHLPLKLLNPLLQVTQFLLVKSLASQPL